MGVEQKRPMLTPGVANFAAVAASARSQVATSWQPAAVAVPCTAAMTGLGQATIACIMAEQRVIVSSKKAMPRSASARWAVSSLRSWPAENTGPAAASTMADTLRSLPSSRNAMCSAAMVASDRLLRLSGRLSVSTATPACGRSSSSACALPCALVAAGIRSCIFSRASWGRRLLQRLLDLRAVRLHDVDVLLVLDLGRRLDRIGELVDELLLVGLRDGGVGLDVVELLLQRLRGVGELARLRIEPCH